MVALSPDLIGISFCSKKDRFNKHLGIKIAKGRALKSSIILNPGKLEEIIPDGKPYSSFRGNVKDVVVKEINKFRDRAEKYFKNNKMTVDA